MWAENAFSASLIGVRAAIEHVLIDLRAVSKNGGNVGQARADLASLMREAADRAAAVPDAPQDFNPDPRPTGLAPLWAGDAMPWGLA